MVVEVGLTVILAVVAPVFHEIPELQLVTVNVAELPAHIVAEPLTLGVGFGVTVTVPVAVPVHVPVPQVAV